MPFLTYCNPKRRRQMRSSKVFFHVHGHSSWNTHQTFHYIYSRSLIVAGLNWKGRAYIQTYIRALERQSGSLNYVFYIDKGTITCCKLFIGYVFVGRHVWLQNRMIQYTYRYWCNLPLQNFQYPWHRFKRLLNHTLFIYRYLILH